MSEFEVYQKYLEANLQAVKQEYERALEAFKVAERQIIGAQYALESLLEYQSKG